ncbi:MAG: ATP-grasp domain-containing protein [Candidatus Nanopelagicales bacterium]|jgi:propionyl-CoA carboxylase alpha chain|nr:ATP-grasp domain-containing protein [Candidatus Nanopelagicales bacterium]
MEQQGSQPSVGVVDPANSVGRFDYAAGGGMRPIRRILVANRGEIARRVIRTARAMGLQAVAIHSDPDAGAPFVRDADLAVAIGGRTSAESYLVVEKVLDAARRSGADAIHPGYGFLSENPEFALAVAEAGLAWIGPTPASMRAMALKVEAKRLVAAAGVPLVPGAELAADASDAEITAAGAQVGFPLLVKASAGGGGKGMRLVRDPAELLEAVSGARNEAASAFGDPTVFMERYLERGRHVEVQVFGDTHGNVVHLFERECSIQRRHQKVVEESPSPGATEVTLERMYAAAVAAARAIDYVGAGTVEFMVAGEGDAQEFFFLEMNTRLQVEHPVTEEVTGLDLVEWQIRVARGEELPLAQAAITRSGHAIEVRLYAEDPARGYLPGIGRIERFVVPDLRGVRVETGVESGSEVSAFYDPMLAKVIAHGVSRAEASATLAGCLEALEVAGVPTNRESLAAVLREPGFLAGDTTTAYLEEHPAVAAPLVDRDELARHLVAAALGLAEQERAGQPWVALAPAGWRNVPAVPEVRRFAYADGGTDRTLEVHYARRRDGSVAVTLGGDLGDAAADAGAVLPATLEVTWVLADGEHVQAEFDGVGTRYRVRRAGDWVLVTGLGRTTVLRVLPRYPDALEHAHDHGLVTPVPGTVTQVLVAPGDAVAAGDTLVVLEAMKMEHRIKADGDGVVAEVRVAVGDSVDAHHVVAVLEEE